MAHSAASLDNKASILVVDDHPIFRRGVTQLLNSEPGLMVCGEAGDITSATQVLEARGPDLVLLELRLGTSDVFELIKGWKGRFPELRVLILSAYDETLYAERALRAGATTPSMTRGGVETSSTKTRPLIADRWRSMRSRCVMSSLNCSSVIGSSVCLGRCLTGGARLSTGIDLAQVAERRANPPCPTSSSTACASASR